MAEKFVVILTPSEADLGKVVAWCRLNNIYVDHIDLVPPSPPKPNGSHRPKKRAKPGRKRVWSVPAYTALEDILTALPPGTRITTADGKAKLIAQGYNDKAWYNSIPHAVRKGIVTKVEYGVYERTTAHGGVQL